MHASARSTARRCLTHIDVLPPLSLFQQSHSTSFGPVVADAGKPSRGRDPISSRRREDSDENGEDAVLRRQGRQEGAVDYRGGQAAGRLRPGQRLRQLAPAPQARRAESVRQELPAAVDELPAPGHQARALHHRGAQHHPPTPWHRRQQVVHDRGAAAGPDGQRDQELLEHPPQEEAPPGVVGRRRRGRRPARRVVGLLPRRAPHGAVGDRPARGRGAPLPHLVLHRDDGDLRHRVLVVVRRRRARRRARHLPAPLELRGRGVLPLRRRAWRRTWYGRDGGGERARRAGDAARARRRLLGGVDERSSGGGRVPGIPGPCSRGVRAAARPARRVCGVPGGRRARRGISVHSIRITSA